MTFVSVVIPASGRMTLLRRTLEALSHQRVDGFQFEVLVVHNAAQPPAGTMRHARVKHCFASDFGVAAFNAAAARNLGAQLADTQADILLFLDADMLAPSWLLQFHMAVHVGRSRPAVCLGARRLLRPSSSYPRLGPTRLNELDAWLGAQDYDPDERMEFLSLNPPDWGCLYAHNFSLKREVFIEVGGFDPGYAGCGVEDVELGFRLHRAGVPFVFLNEIWACHQHHPRSRARWRSNLHNLARLAATHPELQDFAHDVAAGWALRVPLALRPQLDALRRQLAPNIA